MAFSTRQAKRRSMSAELRDWCATAKPEDSRTLVLKLSARADVEQLSTLLRDLGAEVVSAGPAVTVANIACQAVERASKLPGVVEIEMPGVLFPRSGSSSLDPER